MSVSGTNPNVLDLCRLCLVKDESLIPVFDSSQTNQLLCDKINLCLAVQISSEDRISQQICISCLFKIDSFYEFRVKSSESQQVLESWLQTSETTLQNDADLISKDINNGNDLVLFSNLSESNSCGDNESEGSDSSSSEDDSSSEESESADRENEPLYAELHPVSSNVVVSADAPGPSGLQAANNDNILPLHCQESCDNNENKDILETERHDNNSGLSYVGDSDNDVLQREFTKNNSERQNAVRNACDDHSNYKNYKLSVQNKSKGQNKRNKNNNKTLFECSLCKFTAKYQSQLDIHLKRHKKDYSIFCNICQKGFFYQYEIELHRALHEDGKRFECLVCHKKFVYRHSLVAHAKKHASESDICKRLFECDTCGKTFTSKSYLRKHSHIHSGINRVVCDICGMVLSNSVTFKSHQRTHTGERPFSCNICGRKFNTKKYMTIHMRTHTGLKPFKCQTCDKSFSQQSTLIVHQRYHTGHRPYQCHLCKKAFVTKTILKIHQRKHTF